MSVDAMNWAGLCRVPGAGDRARAVLDALAWWAADAGDPNAARAFPPVEIPEGHAACWRGIAEIAQRSDADTRTVRRILKRFEAAGLITRRRRNRVDGQVARRTSDAIYLNLLRPPVHIERDPAGTERRRKAAIEAHARRVALRPAQGDMMPSRPRGQEVPSVVTDLGGPLEDIEPGAKGASRPGAKRASCPGVVQDTDQHTRQDTSQSSPEPTRAREAVASSQEKYKIALTAMGNRRKRKLPKGDLWQPLRELGGAAFDGGVDRVLAELIEHGHVPEDWWAGGRDAHNDVWRRVRAEMLRQQNGEPLGVTAEEVA